MLLKLTILKTIHYLNLKIYLNVFSIFLIQTPPTPTTPSTVEQQITTWSTSIQSILNVVTGLFAIVGGFLIFLQYMQGNDQAQKNFIKFVIGLAIFGLVNVISSFFL